MISFYLVDNFSCRPLLLPDNGYYVNDIQWIYAANSSIQVACKDGYTLVDNYGASNGIAVCQPNGDWDQHFYCLGK